MVMPFAPEARVKIKALSFSPGLSGIIPSPVDVTFRSSVARQDDHTETPIQL